MKRNLVLAIVLPLIALGDRVWQLEFQSLWWDEGVSIYLSGVGVRALTIDKDFSVDLHAPGYHLALAAWRMMLGPSVFSDRLLSVFAGVLTVSLTYAFARNLVLAPSKVRQRLDLPSLRLAPLVAAILAATSPIDVFYSQETRMYAFLPVLGLLSLIATVRLLRDGRRRDWLLWTVVNLAAWYVYYYLALLTIAESLAVLVVWGAGLGRERRPNLPAWGAANLALVLGYLPWLAIVARRALDTSLALPPETATHPTPSDFAVDIARSLTLGFTSPPGGIPLLVLWVMLASLGTVTLWRRNRAAAVVLVGAVVVPILGAGIILVARPFFYPRFILFVVGPLWALASIGVSSVHRSSLVAGIILLPIVAGSGWTWYEERTTLRSGYSSSDYRIVFDSLAPLVQPGDAIVGGYPWEAGYVEAYFWRQVPRVAFVPRGVEASSVASLQELTKRFWVFSYDPDRRFSGDRLDAVLGAAGTTMAVDQYGDSRLRLYAESSIPSIPSSMDAATFDGEIALDESSVRPVNSLRPGDSLTAELRWRAIRKPQSNDTVFVHLIGPDGKLWGQTDSPPVEGMFPTGRWSTGEVVVDRPRLALAPDAPDGLYQVEVGLYQPDTGRRLTVGPLPQPDNRVVIGTFTVRGK